MEILYIVVALILIVALRFAKTNKYGKKNHKSNLSNNRTFRDNKKIIPIHPGIIKNSKN